MGLITNLIRSNEQKKQQDLERNLGIWSTIANLPNASDETRNVAYGNIATLAGDKLGLPKAHHGTFAQILSGTHDLLSNLNPAPSDSVTPRMQPIPQAGPATASPGNDDSGAPLPGAPAYSPFLTDAQVASRSQGIKTQGQQADFAEAQRQQAATVQAKQDRLDRIFQDKTDPMYKSLSAELQSGLTIPRPTAATMGQPVSLQIKDENGERTIPALFDPLTRRYTNLSGQPIDPTTITSTAKQGTIRSGGKITLGEQQIATAHQAWAEAHQTTVDKMTATQKVEAQAEFKNKMHEGQGILDSEGVAGLAKAIETGEQPPTLNGLYRNAAAVRAQFAKDGFNMTQATLDWRAMDKFVQVQNGATQQRIRQATSFAVESLDLLEDKSKALSAQIPRSRFPVLNKVAMAAALSGSLGQDAQNAASDLQIQIRDLQSEMATVYKGGNSPTDVGLKTAMDILNGDWNESRLGAAIQLARANLRIRINSLKNIGISGLSPNSVYGSQAATISDGSSGTPPPAAGGTTTPRSGSKTVNDYLAKHNIH